MTTRPSPPRPSAAPSSPTDDRARSTTPQRNEAGGPPRQPPREGPYADMKLPHERDQTSAGEPDDVHDPNGTRAVTRQGAKDIASGQQDTDCYNANAPRYDVRQRKT